MPVGVAPEFEGVSTYVEVVVGEAAVVDGAAVVVTSEDVACDPNPIDIWIISSYEQLECSTSVHPPTRILSASSGLTRTALVYPPFAASSTHIPATEPRAS